MEEEQKKKKNFFIKNNNDEPNKNDEESRNELPRFKFTWIFLMIGIALMALQFYKMYDMGAPEINMQRFIDIANKGHVEKVDVVNNNYAEVYIKKDALNDQDYGDLLKNKDARITNRFYTIPIGTTEVFAQELKQINSTLPKDVPSIYPRYIEKTNWLPTLFSYLIPILFVLLLWFVVMRKVGGAGGGPGSQIFNIGKSKATLFDNNTKVNTTFADVAGLDEAKEEVMEIVDFLKNPKKYTTLGGKIPKGVLLVGPPGTGKTLLAKAVAGEAGAPFFSISGSDFVEMFVGVGASRVRDLFKQAREKAPCIIFIDEIDAIGRARGKGSFQGGNDERENTLNQLLVEMDGFPTDKGVILMAATNRPDILDNALLRPGRFDRQIGIGRPDLKGREQIFSVHLKTIKLSEGVNASELAEMTPGFVGADIANVCNEAALIAARKGKLGVELTDFHYALDKVIGGLEKKNKIISPEEKEIIAYHEAGHAICGWFLEHAHPLVKVTIVPRGLAALGYAQYLPKEQYITREEKLLDDICMTLGGRAAEQVVFSKISTGAQSDLDHITKMAYEMIISYGMNSKVGNISFYSMMQDTYNRPFSEQTAYIIDQEVRNLIETQYVRAQNLLIKHRTELDNLAKTLLQKEVLHKADLEALIGKRPFGLPPEIAITSAQHPEPETRTHASDI